MPAASLARRSALALLLSACATLAFAQAPAAPAYEPHAGQPGKDVVWVPTPQVVVDKMLELAKVGAGDVVIDLGSGDGRTVITAAKRGAAALGIEYNPDMVELSKRNAEKAGVAAKASFAKADIFEADFSKATVITMFLLPDLNLRLRPKLLALKPGTRIASNTFTMADWEPDERVTLGADAGCSTYWCTALLWIVPVQAAGIYNLPQGNLVLRQNFQMLSGTLTSGGKTYALEDGRVRGEEILFRAGGKSYRGAFKGNALELR